MRYPIDDDVRCLIITGRRTGTVWLQALIGFYLCSKYNLPKQLLMQTEKLTSENEAVPTLTLSHDPQHFDLEDGEDEVETREQEYRGKKLVLLFRHPLDTLVSEWHMAFHRRFSYQSGPNEFVREYLANWMQFYEDWLTADKSAFDGFHTLSYEQLQKRPDDTLFRLLLFILNETPDKKLIADAVDFASFSNMQEMERHGVLANFYQVPDMRPMQDVRALRARRGKVGAYDQVLDFDTIKWAERVMQKHPCVLQEFF